MPITIRTAAGGIQGNDKVRVNSADTLNQYLEDKLVEGDNITLTTVNTGGVRTIEIESTATGSGLSVRESDSSPNVSNVDEIVVTNGHLTDNTGGTVTLAIPGALTVKEVDASPSVADVTTIRVSNGTLTDDGSGQVTINTGGGGSSIIVEEIDGTPSVTGVTTIKFKYVNNEGGGLVNIPSSLNVRELDGTPSVENVEIIRFANGSVTDDGGGTVTVNNNASGISVQEEDSVPTVSNVTNIRVPDGYLTDNTGGSVSLDFPVNLSELQDTDIDTPLEDDILKFDGTNWVNSGTGGGVANINDLGDVTITSVAAHDVLWHNGSGQFINAKPWPAAFVRGSETIPGSTTTSLQDFTGLEEAFGDPTVFVNDSDEFWFFSADQPGLWELSGTMVFDGSGDEGVGNAEIRFVHNDESNSPITTILNVIDISNTGGVLDYVNYVPISFTMHLTSLPIGQSYANLEISRGGANDVLVEYWLAWKRIGHTVTDLLA